MTAHIDPERLLGAYLAPAHDQLPDRVLASALADIARTPQRRALGVPWRFPRMSNVTRLAAAGILALLVVGGAIYLAGSRASVVPLPTASALASPTASAGPTVAASPSPPPPSATRSPAAGLVIYTSSRYGFSIDYPEGWSVTPADRDWTISEEAWDEHSMAAEQFFSPDSTVRVSAWAQSKPSSVTLDSWFSVFYCRDHAGCQAAVDAATPISMLGHDGVLVSFPEGVQAFVDIDDVVYGVAGWGPGTRTTVEQFVANLSLGPTPGLTPIPSPAPKP